MFCIKHDTKEECIIKRCSDFPSYIIETVMTNYVTDEKT